MNQVVPVSGTKFRFPSPIATKGILLFSVLPKPSITIRSILCTVPGPQVALPFSVKA